MTAVITTETFADFATRFLRYPTGGALKEFATDWIRVCEDDVYEDASVINVTYLRFQVKEFYLGSEDVFGQPNTSYVLICDRRYYSAISEYEEETTVALGDDFPDADSAVEFAQFVVQSYKRNYSFKACPVVIYDPEY